MKVALVHDDLMQWGGAERVLLELSEIFPDAPIYTSIYNEQNKILKDKFKDKKIISSFLQKIPFNKNLYKALLPLYPMAFEQFDFSDFDLVISQSTRFAKSVITKPETKHICICHTPPRFLWNFSGEKINFFLNSYFSKLRIYDRISSKRVDQFIAGSKNAQNRIKKVYGIESKICYPFVDPIFFQNKKSFDGGYFLIISRLNKYKKVDLAVEAFMDLNLKLKIIGVGPKLNSLKLQGLNNSNIETLGNLPEGMLINLLSGCRGLIVCSEEDFGLTSLEAQAMGKGVIAYKKGGSLETVIDGKTGVFFNLQTKQSLKDAISKFDSMNLNSTDCIANAYRFSKNSFKVRLLNLIKEV